MNRIIYLLSIVSLLAIGCSSPKAGFSFNQDDKVAPANVQFENKSTKAESYFWDFGDGNTSTQEMPEHRYVLSGKYQVTLKAIKGDKESIEQKEIIFSAPEACLIEMVTSEGTMTIKLYDDTPKHRDNFIKLAEEGFYEGLLFHRVIEGFMVQGGDPNSKNAAAGKSLGSGGPGYKIDAEMKANNVHVKGALAAARQGDAVNPKKKSSGSQFYIVHGKPVSETQLEQLAVQNSIKYTEEQKKAYLEVGGTPFLDMGYTVFGIVTKGLHVVAKIGAVQTARSDRPLEDVVIKSVRVIK